MQAHTTQNREQFFKNNYVRQQLLADDDQRKRIRANASLPDEAWSDIDDAVFPAMEGVLNIFGALRGAGLTVDESIFNKTTEWQPLDDDHEASVNMTPEAVTTEGNVDFELDGAPVPAVHADFSIGFRESGTPDNMRGGSLDTLNAEAAGRAVAEKVEDLILNGWDPSIGSNGYSAYGLKNHPMVHSGTLSDWSTAPGDIRDNVRTMAGDLKDDNFYPDSSGYWLVLDRDLYDETEQVDPDGDGNLLVRDRVDELSAIDRIMPSDTLGSGEALMFRPTSDVVDLAIAEEEQTVQWGGPFRDHFKVLTIFTPRVKADARDQCGIAHYTGGLS